MGTPSTGSGTYTASGNSLLAVGMPCAFYSQHNVVLKNVVPSGASLGLRPGEAFVLLRIHLFKKSDQKEPIKADEGYLVGYSVNCKAFRVFNSRTRIVQETLHIKFLEKQRNVVGIGPKWLFDIDTLTMSMNYQPVVVENQPNDNAGIKENFNACKAGKKTVSAQQYVMLPLWSTGSQDPQNTDDDVTDAAFDVKENENNVYVSANESDKTNNKKHDEKAKRDDKGKSLVDSLTGVRDLRADFEEFSFNNSNRVNVVSAPINAARPNPTNSTNTFNTASPSVNVVNDEEDVGAKADLSNLKTNIHVSPIPTTRVYKDHPDNQIIGNLNSAFQTRSMKRMVKEQEPKKVLQALIDPSQIEAMQEELLQFKLQKVWVLVDLPKGKRVIGSKWVFRNKKDGRVIVIRNKARLVAQGHTQEEGIDYDEVFAPVARIEAIRLFLAYASFMGFMVYKVVKALYGLHQAPRAWYETLANYLLENGLQIKQKDDEIFIRQNKYIAKTLRKFGFTNVKSVSTPIKTEKPLLKDPDGKPHLGLWYPRDSSFNLVAYSDIDYAGASLDRKSTTGELTIPKQTTLGKEFSNPFMAGSLPNTIWVECLSDAEIFEELARMGYEKPPLKLTFYKRTAWNEFSYFMASAIIYLATGRKFNFSKYIFDSMVRNVDSPTKEESKEARNEKEVKDFKGMKIAAIDTDEGIILVDKELDKEEVAMDAESQGRLNQEDVNAASKGVSAISAPELVSTTEPTVFDDEDVTMTMAQTLIKLKAEKAKIIDEQIAQKLHDKEVQKATAMDKQERAYMERALEL
nr:hypothetical protein [Tanacetum cinerariifolium]